MKGSHLGEFEELVLLTIAILNGKAYGVLVAEEIKNQSGRKVSLSSVHTAMYRLETKGFVRSDWQAATKERGGRRKRVYAITANGHRALTEARGLRERMWNLMPKFDF